MIRYLAQEEDENRGGRMTALTASLRVMKGMAEGFMRARHLLVTGKNISNIMTLEDRMITYMIR